MIISGRNIWFFSTNVHQPENFFWTKNKSEDCRLKSLSYAETRKLWPVCFPLRRWHERGCGVFPQRLPARSCAFVKPAERRDERPHVPEQQPGFIVLVSEQILTESRLTNAHYVIKTLLIHSQKWSSGSHPPVEKKKESFYLFLIKSIPEFICVQKQNRKQDSPVLRHICCPRTTQVFLQHTHTHTFFSVHPLWFFSLESPGLLTSLTNDLLGPDGGTCSKSQQRETVGVFHPATHSAMFAASRCSRVLYIACETPIIVTAWICFNKHF